MLFDGFCYRQLVNDRVYRVFAVCPDEGFVVVARQCCTSTRLQRVSLVGLQKGLAAKTIIPVIIEDEPLPSKRGDAAEAAYQKIRPAIEKLLAPGYVTLSGRKMWRDIGVTADEIGIPAITLKQAFTRVLLAGGAVGAAAPRWERCGRKKSSGPTEGYSIGVTNQPNSYPLSAVDFSKIRRGVVSYLRGSRTWNEAYEEFLEAEYPSHQKIIGGEVIVESQPVGKRPSIGQFIRHGCRLVSYEDRLKQQIGELAVQTDKRGRPYGQSYDAIYPGQVAEIDWTLIDNVAVARGSRLAIGRLVLYAVADVGSGLILSPYATLENASVAEAGTALTLCMEDKVQLCARVGLTITSDMWNATAFFRELRSDKGEIESWKATGLVSQLGLKLEHCPARRGDLKGTIESFFNIVRWKMRKLRGATSGHKERLKDHPNVTAIYDMDQLIKLLYVVAIEFNWRKRKRQARTQGMVADQLEPIPQLLFNWAEERGCTRQVDINRLRAGALPTYFVSVTAEGIKHEGLHYLIPEFEPLAHDGINPNTWMIEAKRRTREVEITIDRSTVDHIWLRHHRIGKPPATIKCDLSPEHVGFRGLSWSEYEYFTDRIGEKTKAAATTTRDIKSWARAIIAKTSQEAAAVTDAAREGLSTSAQISGAAERKKLEQDSLHTTTPSSMSVNEQASSGGCDFDDEQWRLAKAHRMTPPTAVNF